MCLSLWKIGGLEYIYLNKINIKSIHPVCTYNNLTPTVFKHSDMVSFYMFLNILFGDLTVL